MFTTDESELLYGGEPNLALLKLIGSLHGSVVLDLGCGQGAIGPHLRAAGAERIVGLDISEASAAIARTNGYDDVLVAPLESVTFADLGERPFDLVVAADVLEHLVDPWTALARVATWTAPGARIAVSVPNLRYFRIVLRLVVRGDFEYVSSGGLMDRGHLRWFTRSTLDQALRAAGWAPVAASGGSGARRRLVSRLTSGALDGVLWHQLFVIAERR